MASHQVDMLQATVLADIAIVLVAGAALLRIARLARQPAVVGEIFAGILVGPSVLGLFPGHLTSHLFPMNARPYLSAIAQVALLLFMFTLGWELDPGNLRLGKTSIAAVSLGSMALPFMLGLGAAVVCYPQHSTVAGRHIGFGTFAVYLGITMSVTAFPVLARILADSRLGSTPVGTLALASAAMGDMLAWCLLAVVVGLATASSPSGFAFVIAWSAAYIAVMAGVVRPLLRVATARMFRRNLTAPTVGLMAAGIFLSAYATSRIGIHPIFGAFAFGIVTPRHPRERLEAQVLRPLKNASMILLPVYFIVTGLSVDFGALHGRDFADLALIVTVACVGKIVGATVPARVTGMGWREALGVGMLMNTRGLTELIILNVGLSLHMLDTRLFTSMVIMALVTTAMAGPLLPRLVPRPQTAPIQRPLVSAVAGTGGSGGDGRDDGASERSAEYIPPRWPLE